MRKRHFKAVADLLLAVKVPTRSLHQLLPEGLLIVVTLGMFPLIEDEGVVNGNIH
jgi:hypothetical protein